MGKFIEWNKNWCFKFLERHPLDRRNINNVYVNTVAKYLRPGNIIYDVGSGKHCKYIKSVDKDSMYVFALDNSEEELLYNQQVDGTIVADVCDIIPIPYGKVDIITSSNLCEYLTNTKKFYKNAYKALKPYGLFINMFPCRYGLSSIIKRLLPKDLTKKVMDYFSLNTGEEENLTCYYDGLWYKKIKEDYKNAGFRIEKIYLRYLQCDYYNFFIPLFLINYFWDWCMKKLRIKKMCSHMLIVARKL